MKKLLVLLSLIFAGVSYADTETIKWYVDGSVYTTTTCQSGGDITLQTPPTKRGHTFTGWEVALYDFSTLDPSINGTNNTSTSNKRWITTFPYGQIYGIALCSITKAGTPDETTPGETKYCWCKATDFVPTGSEIAYKNTSSSSWTFRSGPLTSSGCESNCMNGCGLGSKGDANFRRTLFGVTQ